MGSLIIENYELDQEFNKEIYEYTITVPWEISELSIDAILEDSKSIIEIIGNEGFIEGNNLVEIKVTAEDGTEQIYSINVIKEVEEDLNVNEKEEMVEEKEKSLIPIIVISGGVVLGVLTIGIGVWYKIFKKVK